MRPFGAEVSVPKVRVLIADEERVIADTLASVLDLSGYDVCAVYGGEAAQRLLQLFQPTLVITDVTTVGTQPVQMDLGRLLGLTCCKVLLFTGQPDLYDLLRTEDAITLPFHLFTMPIDPRKLLKLIKADLHSDHPPLILPLDTTELPVH